MQEKTRNMMVLKSKREEYDLFNKLSDEWWDENGKFKVLHQIRPIRIEYILNQLNKKNIKKLDILDIGCGGGLVSESLAKLGGNITGIDFVESNIKIAKLHAKKNGLNIKYLCKDVEKFQFNKKFDIIIAFEVLEHLDNWKDFLKNIKRNLKQNGRLIVSTINRNIISKYTAITIAENILNWIPVGTHDYDKFIKPTEIKSFLEKEGFSFKDIKGLIFNPLVNSWRLSENTSINYFSTYYKVN